MKLAILALCRLNKKVIIISSNKKYYFIIKEDKLILKDNKPQKCLHFKYEIINNNNNTEKIFVIINNINRKEWAKQIINYIWLLNDDTKIYTSFNERNREIGQILSEEYLRGKIYVKGIFVQYIESLHHECISNCLGFNIDVKLNRDRNYITSNYELKNLITLVISSFCNNNIKYILEKEKEREIEKKFFIIAKESNISIFDNKEKDGEREAQRRIFINAKESIFGTIKEKYKNNNYIKDKDNMPQLSDKKKKTKTIFSNKR